MHDLLSELGNCYFGHGINYTVDFTRNTSYVVYGVSNWTHLNKCANSYVSDIVDDLGWHGVWLDTVTFMSYRNP